MSSPSDRCKEYFGPRVNKGIVVVEGLWNGTAVRRWKGGRGGLRTCGGKVDHDGSGSRIEWIVAVCFVILLSGREVCGKVQSS